MSVGHDKFASAREKLDENAWTEAYELLREADAEQELSPEWLEELGVAAWWTGRLDDCIDARQRAFAAYLAAGNHRGAAVVALRISHNYQSKLSHAQDSAWFRRAESLLDREEECLEQAHLARRKAANSAAKGELDEALSLAEHALDLATRYGDKDLMALALHDLGRFRITKGEVDEGLRQLDEATLAAMHGEVGPYPTAVIYCNVIEACRDLADFRRAGEWTEAAKRWCERQAIAGFPGQCRVDQAEVLKLRGAWVEAEEAARSASEELKDFRLPVAARAFYEIGEIRLRVGDYAGATEAFAQASELGLDPQPGLALLKLVEGNPDAAAKAIARALEDNTWDRLARARLHPAQAEIAIARSDWPTAQDAIEELRRIGDAYGSDAIRAHASHALAALLLARGDPAAAARAAREAWSFWQEIDAPYEAARARSVLGQALQELGDDDAAQLQLRAARSALHELGASPEARRVAALIDVGQTATPVTKGFMFTDIVASTQLVEAVGDEAWQALVRWHDQALRALFRDHDGEEVDHAGDGFFVAFPDSHRALECAIAIQRRLAEQRSEHGFAPQVRIGVHAAEAAETDGAYFGRGVHEAARIGALAGGAEIVASARSADGRFQASEPRSVSLKGLSEPVDVVTIEWR